MIKYIDHVCNLNIYACIFINTHINLICMIEDTRHFGGIDLEVSTQICSDINRRCYISCQLKKAINSAFWC